MTILRLCCLLVAMVCFQTGAFAQMRGWEVGVWGGASNYFGDLNTNWRINRAHLAGQVSARYNFNDRLALKFGFHAGQISAYDSDSDNTFEKRRNLSFKSIIADGAMTFEFNFLPYVHGHRELFYTPYIFAGPAFFYYNPQAELDGKWYDLVDQGTEGQFRGEEYNTTQGAIAYGIGFKTDLSYRWSINVELCARKVFTDYLDDVSGEYPDVRDVEAQRGELAAMFVDRSEEPKIGTPGRQRGNGKNNDAYATLMVGIHYYFGSIRCPALVR